MTIPASTTLDPRPDDDFGTGERRGKHLTLVREQSPAVRSFPVRPTVAKAPGAFDTPVTKPLGAFEELAEVKVATPLTWGSGHP